MRRKFVRISDDAHKRIEQMRKELKPIEERDVPQGEVIERMLKAEDLRNRLKQGSIERRKRII